MVHSHGHGHNLIALLEMCKTTSQLKQIHSQIIRLGIGSNPTTGNEFSGLKCGARSGDNFHAHCLFGKIPEPSVLIWNAIIKAYSSCESPEYGFLMYKDLLKRGMKPNRYSFPLLLKGFKFSRDIASTCGRQLLAHVVEFGFDTQGSVQRALLRVFSFCGQFQIARQIFSLSDNWDAVAWNELISGYNTEKQFDESKRLFAKMDEGGVLPTSVTFLLALKASSKSKDLEFGLEVHKSIRESMIQSTLPLENALIDMYATCGKTNAALRIFEGMKRRDAVSWTAAIKGCLNVGQIDLARKYFNEMPCRDLISWTSMMDGYLKANEYREVLALFRSMQSSGVRADGFTIVSVLSACANLGALEMGEWTKTYIERNNIKNDVFVGNALIDMYFKCGSVQKATREFNQMSQRDRFTWTTMILGLAVNGCGEEALRMFSEMLRAGIEPDEITYVGVLSACTHSGLAEKGKEHFYRMTAEHGIKPNLVHFGCLIDLLGRSGLLEEAHEIINSMPMKPNAVIWGALLGACRVHKDPVMAELAAKKILELEPENESVYNHLCSVFAACKMWGKLSEARRIMTDKGISKAPGCSAIEMNDSLHQFAAGDQSNPQSEEIYTMLERMMWELRLAGYKPDTSTTILNT